MKSLGFSKFHTLQNNLVVVAICLKKALEMQRKCLNNAVPLLNKTENQIF